MRRLHGADRRTGDAVLRHAGRERRRRLAITTIEAIERTRWVRRWLRRGSPIRSPQCGYCQSGQVMAATALLKQTPQPTDEDIAGAMVNLCRCGTYNAIAAAVRQAAQA